LAGLLVRPAYAQSPAPDSLTQVAHYQQVVLVTGASADELYARAREWVALTFEDAHQVLQLEDPQRHLLLGSGYTSLLTRRKNGTVKTTAPLWFSFRLETRAGRYRLECTDFGSPYLLSSGTTSPAYINSWLTASQATREASSRHSAPGATWNQVIRGEYPEDQLQAKQSLEEAMGKLFTTLKQVETAPATTW
jgi:hypothetical protein